MLTGHRSVRHRAKGTAEPEMRAIEGHMRTMASALHARMGMRIHVGHLNADAVGRIRGNRVQSKGGWVRWKDSTGTPLRAMCEFGDRGLHRVPQAKQMGEQAASH